MFIRFKKKKLKLDTLIDNPIIYFNFLSMETGCNWICMTKVISQSEWNSLSSLNISIHQNWRKEIGTEHVDGEYRVVTDFRQFNNLPQFSITGNRLKLKLYERIYYSVLMKSSIPVFIRIKKRKLKVNKLMENID